MASQIEIWNLALQSAGTRTQVNSLTEQSQAANTLRLFYQSTLEELLAEAQWNFAQKFVTANLLTQVPGAPGNTAATGGEVWSPTYPAPGWLYQYSYPADCLKLNYVIPQGQWGYYLAQAQTDGPWKVLQTLAVPFTISNSAGVPVVNTNAQQAIFEYTMRVDNPAIFQPGFVTALAGRLAKKIVIPLSGDKSMAQAAWQASEDIVRAARQVDANEGLTIIDNYPDWLRARDWPDWYGGPAGWWLTGNY